MSEMVGIVPQSDRQRGEQLGFGAGAAGPSLTFGGLLWVLEQTGSEGALIPSEYPSESLRGQRQAGLRKRPHFLTIVPNAKAAGATCQLLPLSQAWEMGPLPRRPLFSIPSEGWACGECFVDSAQQPALLFYREVGGPGRKALPQEPQLPWSRGQVQGAQVDVPKAPCPPGRFPKRSRTTCSQGRGREEMGLFPPLESYLKHHQVTTKERRGWGPRILILLGCRGVSGETRPPAASLGHLGFGLTWDWSRCHHRKHILQDGNTWKKGC